MKLLLSLLMMISLATVSYADPQRVPVRFMWTQPDSTANGTATQDGWIDHYNIYVATPVDTVFYGTVAAPTVVADTASAYVNLQIGLPSSVAVSAVDVWLTEGERSIWSDTHIVIPEPQRKPGKPFSVKE